MSQEKAAEILDFTTPGGEPAKLGGDETAGAFLAAARRSAGLSLEAISDVIKVKIDHLEAIEATRPDLLPAAPYATGFVKVYARALGLDADAVASRFREDIGAAEPAQLLFEDAEAGDESRSDLAEGVRMASIFAVIAIGLFVFWMVAYILGRSDDTETEIGSPAVETVGERASDIPRFTPRETTAPVVETPAESTPPVEVEAGPFPRVKPAIIEASLIESVAPGYPEACIAGAAPLETVTVVFDINADGRADNAQVVSSSNACFEGEALRAVALWRFSPRTVGGATSIAPAKRATLNFKG